MKIIYLIFFAEPTSCHINNSLVYNKYDNLIWLSISFLIHVHVYIYNDKSCKVLSVYKGPFALDDNDVFFLSSCALVKTQPISDDMLTTLKICVAVAKYERTLSTYSFVRLVVHWLLNHMINMNTK